MGMLIHGVVSSLQILLDDPMNQQLLEQLAPTGVLRVGLNMSNFLLVTGTAESGEPDGVSPAIAQALAEELGVAVRLVPFKGPGEVADAAGDNVWDIANIAAEPERAKSITFSSAYCEIQATYLLPVGSSLQSINDVDTEGVRIAVKERAAYQLWLTDHLEHATLEMAPSIDASYELFVNQSLDALAGLRPKLLEQQQKLPGSRILDASFTAVQQSIGCRPGRPEAAAFIQAFVQKSIASGRVATLIDRYGVKGKLSVAPLL